MMDFNLILAHNSSSEPNKRKQSTKSALGNVSKLNEQNWANRKIYCSFEKPEKKIFEASNSEYRSNCWTKKTNRRAYCIPYSFIYIHIHIRIFSVCIFFSFDRVTVFIQTYLCNTHVIWLVFNLFIRFIRANKINRQIFFVTKRVLWVWYTCGTKHFNICRDSKISNPNDPDKKLSNRKALNVLCIA